MGLCKEGVKSNIMAAILDFVKVFHFNLKYLPQSIYIPHFKSLDSVATILVLNLESLSLKTLPNGHLEFHSLYVSQVASNVRFHGPMITKHLLSKLLATGMRITEVIT